MAEISKVLIGNTEYNIQDAASGYSEIQISNLLSSGKALGTITLNGTNYIIYAPSSSSSGGLEVSIASNSLILNNSSESSSDSSVILYDGTVNYWMDSDEGYDLPLDNSFNGTTSDIYSVELDGVSLSIYDIIEYSDSIGLLLSEVDEESEYPQYPLQINLQANTFSIGGALNYENDGEYPGDHQNHTLKITWTPNN